MGTCTSVLRFFVQIGQGIQNLGPLEIVEQCRGHGCTRGSKGAPGGLGCQQKIQAFTAFLHSLVYWRKRRPWTKKGTHIQKKVPCRTPISRRGPIWEQCKCWKPFLGVYMQLSSLLSRLWSEGGTGQDGGTRPKFLQGKICHCFVNFLSFFPNFFAPYAPNAPNGGLSMSKKITCPLPFSDNSYFLKPAP